MQHWDSLLLTGAVHLLFKTYLWLKCVCHFHLIIMNNLATVQVRNVSLWSALLRLVKFTLVVASLFRDNKTNTSVRKMKR